MGVLIGISRSGWWFVLA